MSKYIILPISTDLNRGDQALVWETKRIAEEAGFVGNYYAISNIRDDMSQTIKENITPISVILRHPSRENKKVDNLSYDLKLKLKWGFIAVFDFLESILLLNGVLRKMLYNFLGEERKRTIDLISDSDACFVKGGGFIHSYGGIVGLYYMYFSLYHIMLPQKMNKDVYIMPNSFGPIRSGKKMVDKVLRKCKFVSSRESISTQVLLDEIDLTIDTYPDLGFFLRKSKSVDFEIHNPGKLVAITMRPYRFPNSKNPQQAYSNYKDVMRKFIEWIFSEGYFPVIVDHTISYNKHESDLSCISEVIDTIDSSKYIVISNSDYTCRDLKKIYSQCDYILATRFHSMIFSLAEGIPGIAITYGGNKGQGIMRDMGLEKYAIPIEHMDFDILKNMFCDLINNRSEIKNKINDYLKYADEKRKVLIEEIHI